jgi:predicted nuclease of predicted toxin-antitoxin system
MKLLLDQGLPRSAAMLLRNAGTDTVHTGEIGLATADDDVILERGRLEGRIIVTLDADFHRLMALSGATLPSVIRIRIEGLRGDALAQLLLEVLSQSADDLGRGVLVSVQEMGIRLRRLPLSP